MGKKSTEKKLRSSTVVWTHLESMVRENVRSFIQQLLDEEADEFLGGRGRYERKSAENPQPGYRNGRGKPRKLTLSCGTMEVRRPRVRDMDERFESAVLPFFVRRTREVDTLIPELYLHGLAAGDMDLALRGLLGNDAPISAGTVARLKERWQREYQEWSSRSLAGLEVVALWVAGAETEEKALALRGTFQDWCRKRGHGEAADLIEKDWEQLVAFYRFPKEHWQHLRTSNPIESPFDRVRMRTNAARRFKRVENATAVVWKTLMVAEKRFGKLNSPELWSEVFKGAVFKDGVRVVTSHEDRSEKAEVA